MCELKNASSNNLLGHAVATNNLQMVKFIFEQTLKYREEEYKNKPLCIPNWQFDTAMRKGYTDLMGYLITRTGIEFPFQSLMKKAGVAPAIKSKVSTHHLQFMDTSVDLWVRCEMLTWICCRPIKGLPFMEVSERIGRLSMGRAVVPIPKPMPTCY